MNRIHFENLDKKNPWSFLMALSLILVIAGLIYRFKGGNDSNDDLMISSGCFLQAVYFSRIFWYKNNVHWNNTGFTIRVNSFFGRTINYKSIRTTSLSGNALTLTKTNGQEVLIDLSSIEEADIEELNETIRQKQIAKK